MAHQAGLDDILHVLGLDRHEMSLADVRGRNADGQALLDLMVQGFSDGNELQLASRLDVATFNQTLTMLELSGKVRALGANKWTVR